jgi:hypothetical protein
MKRQFIFLILILFSFIVSCKKKSTVSTSNPTNNSGTPVSKKGYLTACLNYNILAGGTLYGPQKSVTAVFINDIFHSNGQYITAGNVYTGTHQLVFGQLFPNEYSDTTFLLQISPTVWKISGSGTTVPGFTYTNNDSVPKYSGTTLLPDTIYKSQNLVLKINGISGADQLSIFLSDNLVFAQITQSIDTVRANNTITIRSADMSALSVSTTSPTCTMFITLDKNNDQTFGGYPF